MTSTLPSNDKITIGVHGYAGCFLIEGSLCIHPKLTTRCIAIGRVTLGVDATATAVLKITFPNNDKITISVHGYAGESLIIGSHCIYQKFTTCFKTVSRITLCVNAISESFILTFTFPSNDKITIGVQGYAGVSLIIVSLCINQKLPTRWGAIGRVTLRVDAPTIPVLAFTRPSNDKITIGVYGYAGTKLCIRSLCIHQKLTTRSAAIGRVTLGVNASKIAVLTITCPSNDKITISIHGYAGIHLMIGSHCIHQKLTARLDAISRVTLGVDAIMTAVLNITMPSNNKITIGVHG